MISFRVRCIVRNREYQWATFKFAIPIELRLRVFRRLLSGRVGALKALSVALSALVPLVLGQPLAPIKRSKQPFYIRAHAYNFIQPTPAACPATTHAAHSHMGGSSGDDI